MDLTSEQVIEIANVEKKPGNLGIFLTLVFLLLVVVLVGFSNGFLFGQMQANSNETVLQRGGEITSDQDGNKIYTDSANSFEITFDPSFEVKERDEAIPGISLAKDESRLDLWLDSEQPLELSNEQKEALDTTNHGDLEIVGQKAKVVEHVYKNGSYFSEVTLEATDDTPLVTFWLKAPDKENYETLKKTSQTFKFL